jgi:SAM-dependent methyltransferase
MKFSEIVAFKNRLDELVKEPAQKSVDFELRKILHLFDCQNEVDQTNLLTTYKDIHNSFDNFNRELMLLKDQIVEQIEQKEKFWLAESYRLFEEEIRQEHHDYILNRRGQLTAETELRSRLQMHAEWKYPGMIIRPGLETLITEMVSYDPLYLVDTSMDLLRKVPLVNNFTPEYQTRLRNIVVSETLEEEILVKVPNSQFGLCLVYNFFSFRPLEYIKKYLQEIYLKLKPGGILIFTFNDCDREAGVRLAETHYACYTPGKLIKQLTDNIGYSQIHSWHNNGAMTYVEVRKPGNLTSMRGGQTLAKIMRK